MIPWLMTACFYPCIIGPDFWGLVNKHWRMCTTGQLQSPINVDPSVILYDPGLLPLDISKQQVQATLENMGQLPLVTINDSLIEQGNINISGGPSSPYRYRLHHVVIHFGLVASDERGSEHTIDRLGVVSNTELRRLTVASQSITYKGTKTILRRFNAYGLLPQTQDYITYEGSLTFPGCFETVTWVIMNNPIYITKEDLQIWNDLQQTETKQLSPILMSPNYRPLKPLNGRLLRTNINIKYKAKSSQSCPSNLYVDMGYKANPRRYSVPSLAIGKRSLKDNSSTIF
ncbi:putative carbonic anhydrase-like protein 2 [Dirofilaria immitis]|nr:putative carbonic anhydrase-like protein 2 [Dirofilaria immitis]